MAGYYDDNYGWYDIESEDDIRFYQKVQKESKWKKCANCGKRVKLRPSYSICNSCADRMERGFDGY